MTAGVVVLIMAITYGLMLLAEPIVRLIGRNGAAILERVTGMVLAALAIELIMGAMGVVRWINPAS
jgi:multiple antibiotic resistance protein